MVDFVGEGGAERDAVLMLGTRGVDVLVGYGGRLDVEILSEGLFQETPLPEQHRRHVQRGGRAGRAGHPPRPSSSPPTTLPLEGWRPSTLASTKAGWSSRGMLFLPDGDC